MKLFDAVRSGAKKVTEELKKPNSFRKGEKFEDYLRKYVFVKEQYKLVYHTPSYAQNKNDFVESSLYPDFLFKDLVTGKEFYVEAKFRSGFFNNKLNCCKDYQLKRYLQINKEKRPVFMAIGVGGSPTYPEQIFIIPVGSIKYTSLFPSFLKRFEYFVDTPVPPTHLWYLENN